MKVNKYLFHSLTIFSLFFSLISCEEQVEYQPLTGSLGGRVSYYTGTKTGQGGVLVTAHDGITSKTVTSDSSGFFLFEKLQTGTYDIVFEKDSFYTYKIVGHQFVGGNKPSYLSGVFQLFKKNYAKIDSLVLTAGPLHPYHERVNISVYFSDPNGPFSYFRYYVSNSAEVSYTNYMDTGLLTLGTIYIIDTLTFPRGSDLYMIAYPCSGPAREYIDTATGLYIYGVTTENASNVATYTVPETKQ